MEYGGTLLKRPQPTKINTFSREGNSIVKVGQIVFSLEQEGINYRSKSVGAPVREDLKYSKAFLRDLNYDALYVSEQIADSLRYASELKIYDSKEPIKNINVYIGNLNTWRNSVYGSEISTVAAFVYRKSLHIRPSSIPSWNIVQHETGHIIQIHDRREFGRNNYPTPEIREGGAELFRMAFGTKDISDEEKRAEAIFEKYTEMHGRRVNTTQPSIYGYMLLSNSDNRWVKGMECHAAGVLVALAALSVNNFEIGKTVRDLFSVSDVGELSLLLRDRSPQKELEILARNR